MKRYILIGFSGGILLSVCVYSGLFFFTYAPQQYKQSLLSYNGNIPLFETFLECKKCENSGKSPYDCAVEVMRENKLNRFADSKEYLKSQEELLSNRIRSLETKCVTKDIEELKTDPYLLGSRNSSACESYTIKLNLNETAIKCENDIKGYCENPEYAIKTFTQSEFVDAICNAPAALSDYQQASYLKQGVMPPSPTLQDEYKEISNVFEVTYKISEYGYLLQIPPIGLTITILFILFVIFPFAGVFISILYWKKKEKLIN